jgi:hypothetical protein
LVSSFSNSASSTDACRITPIDAIDHPSASSRFAIASLYATADECQSASTNPAPLREPAIAQFLLVGFAGADGIIFWGWPSDFEAAASLVTWNALPAVQAGRVVQANGLLLGSSVYGAMETLRLYDRLYTLIG